MNKDQKVYVKENDVNFRKQSEATDGVQKMKVGQELTIVDGPWFRVIKDGQRGWVRVDYISETIQAPVNITDFVQFVKGQSHFATSEITKKVRKTINDEFGLGKSGDNLNCTEYVSYRIKTKLGIDINWPVQSGRNGGVWWKIFQDAELYKILSEPKVNCAMCFTTGISNDSATNAIGHVVFVEEVSLDGSVKISEANWPNGGKYNERPISKEKWQNKYKAKFIDFA